MEETESKKVEEINIKEGIVNPETLSEEEKIIYSTGKDIFQIDIALRDKDVDTDSVQKYIDDKYRELKDDYLIRVCLSIDNEKIADYKATDRQRYPKDGNIKRIVSSVDLPVRIGDRAWLYDFLTGRLLSDSFHDYNVLNLGGLRKGYWKFGKEGSTIVINESEVGSFSSEITEKRFEEIVSKLEKSNSLSINTRLMYKDRNGKVSLLIYDGKIFKQWMRQK